MMEFEGNPNIGIYMFANDKFCLLGREVLEEKRKEIEKTLGVPVYKTTILGTELLGVFVCGNNEFLVVPEIYEYESDELIKICKKHDVELVELHNKQNTYGNNICFGKGKLLVNPEFESKFKKDLSKKVGFDIVEIDNSQYKAIGSVTKFLNGKYFLSQELEEKQVKPILKDVAGVGTVNSGSNIISSGVVGNKNGLILGSMCSTIEIQAIVESLDYL